jgi:hypothetical protein
MEISGHVGSKTFSAVLQDDSVTLKGKNDSIKIDLLFIGFQRVSKRLKTADVIWVGKDAYCEQTIEHADVEKIMDFWTGSVYDIGLDPGSWKKWHQNSKKESWNLEQWEALLVPDIDPDDSDSDWNPGDASESDDDDEDYSSD